ncbi:MAG: nucleotidyltransferase domain-containing protein [Deltaproteobacteria bacterium]|nr:nucleotidyltransferase domain-containing protein [Deltaproteobacteria bacterium]
MAEFFDVLAKQYRIAAFFLFGSQARGRGRRDSDMDIAILPGRTLTAHEEDALYIALGKGLAHARIDMVNLQTAPLLLKYAVIRHGRCLASYDDDAVTQFIVRTRSEYLDTEHLRSIFARHQSKRIAEGSFGAPQ